MRPPIPPDAGVSRPAPLRTCVACRTKRPATELIRVVVDANGVIGVATPGAPGRGAWLCRSLDCVASVRPGALASALRTPVAPADVEALVTVLKSTLKPTL